MRLRSSIACLCLVALWITGPPGCASPNPRTQYGTANEAYIVAASSVKTLHDTGRINEATYRRDVWPYVERADALLREWDVASQNPDQAGSATVQVLKTSLQAISDYLLTYATAVKSGRPPPTGPPLPPSAVRTGG